MFFEDEKENLENLDNLDDLDLDLSEDGDDESISWDELLKDTPTDISDDDIISITAPAAEAKSSAKSANAKPKKPAGTKKTESSPAKKAAKEDDILAADTAGAAKSTPKQDAFDVFGGDKQSKGAIDADDLSDESESVLDELDGMDEMDDVDDDELKNIGIYSLRQKLMRLLQTSIRFSRMLPKTMPLHKKKKQHSQEMPLKWQAKTMRLYLLSTIKKLKI